MARKKKVKKKAPPVKRRKRRAKKKTVDPLLHHYVIVKEKSGLSDPTVRTYVLYGDEADLALSFEYLEANINKGVRFFESRAKAKTWLDLELNRALADGVVTQFGGAEVRAAKDVFGKAFYIIERYNTGRFAIGFDTVRKEDEITLRDAAKVTVGEYSKEVSDAVANIKFYKDRRKLSEKKLAKWLKRRAGLLKSVRAYRNLKP